MFGEKEEKLKDIRASRIVEVGLFISHFPGKEARSIRIEKRAGGTTYLILHDFLHNDRNAATMMILNKYLGQKITSSSLLHRTCGLRKNTKCYGIIHGQCYLMGDMQLQFVHMWSCMRQLLADMDGIKHLSGMIDS
ncbi:uncharacterized protein PV09_06087 [Verruconis gallopava]|uniref:Uncharacterized protein n=1 Tax=Verruconis gallopava TaxID=253628 RepID=A0A0D2AU41_9PEZI|nr:uncharacterized protein PV09_06087 [Verruconis gallopava]KIW02649.1 hypothetical protein PV09_06087 [Verruconis gallopava]